MKRGLANPFWRPWLLWWAHFGETWFGEPHFGEPRFGEPHFGEMRFGEPFHFDERFGENYRQFESVKNYVF